MSQISNLFKNGLYVGIMNVMSRASGLILSVLLVRILTPETFGLFALFQRIMEKISAAMRLGGFEASTQVLSASNHKNNPNFNPFLVSTPFFLRVLICMSLVVVFSFYPEYIAKNILQQVSLTPYMTFLAFGSAFGAVEVLSEAILKGLNQFKVFSKVNIIFAFILLPVIAVATYFYDVAGSIISLSLCLVARSFIVTGLAAFHAKRIGLSFLPNDFLNTLFQHLKIGLPFYIPILISTPVWIYALSMLTSIAGVDEMAYYRIIITCGIFIHIIPYSLLPVFITSAANEKNSAENISFFYFNMKFTIFISSLIAILLIGILPIFISIIFGSEYALVVKYFVIHGITMIIIACCNVVTSFFLARKQANFVLYANFLQSIVFLGTSMLLIPRFGLPGILVAECISYIACLLAAIILFGVKTEMNYKIFIFVLRCLPFATLFSISIFSIDSIEPVILRFTISIIIAVFLVLFFWKTILSLDDKHAVEITLFRKIPFMRTIFSK
ncbi:oligosaccharide flippase family protein [Gammaproteobacteria bacterium]|nr:oligosaccharide flippase family protein [Gammaproteobacteria bacterium]